jgi:hypothetical protein
VHINYKFHYSGQNLCCSSKEVSYTVKVKVYIIQYSRKGVPIYLLYTCSGVEEIFSQQTFEVKGNRLRRLEAFMRKRKKPDPEPDPYL